MTARTKQNLNTAMLYEALAYAKCRRFAACARMNDSNNLKTAMDDKARQIDMCNEFAIKAYADGDEAAARFFERISRDQIRLENWPHLKKRSKAWKRNQFARKWQFRNTASI